MASIGFLRTRVARRLLALFLLAAFLPAAGIAVVAYSFVNSKVRRDTEARVSRAAKLIGLNTLATLEQLDATFRSAIKQRHPRTTGPELPGFAAITVRRMDEGVPGSNGTGTGRFLKPLEIAHLEGGKTLLVFDTAGGHGGAWLAATDSSAAGNVTWGRLPDEALWRVGAAAIEADGATICIVEARDGSPLFCDAPPPTEASRALADIRGGGRIALASWKAAGTTTYGASWSVFLRYTYGSDDVRIIVAEPGDSVFSSLRKFTVTFASLCLLALLVVFLLSHSQIRRSTQPLEQLQAGTRRLEAGDFSTVVSVDGRDEFGDLAQSFNRMAQTLARQMATLQGLDVLNQAVLGARDSRPVMEAALTRLSAVAQSADVMVAVERVQGGSLDVLLRHGPVAMPIPLEITMSDGDRRELFICGRVLEVEAGESRDYFPTGFATGNGPTLVLPLRGDGRVIGFVAVATSAGHCELDAERFDAVRRLVDRLALALVDVQHVTHLAALSAGTLTAFARAIDANSPWTAGHSERVTAVALAIGERVGLSRSDQSVLRSGGLLHDIGKIGVPPGILDKAAPLTEAERRVIERHPTLGAEILEPIGAFTSAIPIVRSHHERMNGTGYPDGLAGEAIPYLARVLAVADVFEALVSDRPYRAGLGVPSAIEIIQRSTGTHFDPGPVAAFLAAVREGAIDPILVTRTSESSLATSLQAGRRFLEEAAA